VAPTSQMGYWGKEVTLNVKAEGAEPLYYQWLKDGNPIPGAISSVLTLRNLEISDAGNFSVAISNGLGSTTSTPVSVFVNPAGVSIGLYPGITIDGVVGKTYGIQYVTNLLETNNWVYLTNVTLTAPVQLWLDTESNTRATDQPKRFYRVVPAS